MECGDYDGSERFDCACKGYSQKYIEFRKLVDLDELGRPQLINAWFETQNNRAVHEICEKIPFSCRWLSHDSFMNNF